MDDEMTQTMRGRGWPELTDRDRFRQAADVGVVVWFNCEASRATRPEIAFGQGVSGRSNRSHQNDGIIAPQKIICIIPPIRTLPPEYASAWFGTSKRQIAALRSR